MKGSHKFLLVIILSVLLLVVGSMVLLRPTSTYQEEDWPWGVVNNYLLALQGEEFERAYGYLSDTLEGYPPTVDRFAANILDHRDEFQSSSPYFLYNLEYVKTEGYGDGHGNGNEAVVSGRRITFYLFHTTTSTTFTMKLRQIDGAWKIYDSEAYWLDCWQEAEGCS